MATTEIPIMATSEIVESPLQGTVSDIMTVHVKTATWSTSVKAVARVMTRHKLRRILILDQEQRVLGVLSQSDLLRQLINEVENPSGDEIQNVGDMVAGREAVTILPDVPLHGAAIVLSHKKIGCLPIVDADGDLLGVLSASDLTAHLSGEQSEFKEERFAFFNPQKDRWSSVPAFIRRANGSLVLPRKSLENWDEITEFVRLGYDAECERILVQFVATPEDDDGSLKTKIDKDKLIIPACGFIAHFDLNVEANTFDVETIEDGQRLILTPKQTQ
jgi:CBS domain-containing protein